MTNPSFSVLFFSNKLPEAQNKTKEKNRKHKTEHDTGKGMGMETCGLGLAVGRIQVGDAARATQLRTADPHHSSARGGRAVGGHQPCLLPLLLGLSNREPYDGALRVEDKTGGKHWPTISPTPDPAPLHGCRSVVRPAVRCSFSPPSRCRRSAGSGGHGLMPAIAPPEKQRSSTSCRDLLSTASTPSFLSASSGQNQTLMATRRPSQALAMNESI
jgi:hypothetical protein